jgi:hypothetical protein
MTKRKNLWIALGIVLVGAAVVAANLYYRRDKGVVVTTEAIKTRDLRPSCRRLARSSQNGS